MRSWTLVLTFTMLSIGCASTKSMDPMLANKYSAPSAKLLFMPVYNANQPNIVSIEPTEGVRTWLKESGLDRTTSDKRKTAEELTLKIAGEKNFSDDFHAYEDERAANKSEIVSPDDFLTMKVPLCVEKAVFLAAALIELGIEPNIYMIEIRRGGEMVTSHMFVKAWIGGEPVILDSRYGTMQNDIAMYKEYYTDVAVGVGFKGGLINVYPLVEYVPEYNKYIKDQESEKVSEKIFEQMRKLLTEK